MSDGGKGSKPRPFSVDSETYADNWNRIFGKQQRFSKENNSLEQAFDRAIIKDEYYDLDSQPPEK